MRKLLATIVLCAFTGFTFAQNPGGIGTGNLTAWFKAETISPGFVTSWSSSYPNGGSAITLSDLSSPYAEATNTPANSIMNYNACIDFATNTDASNMVLQNLSAFNFLDNNTAGGQGTFFSVYYLPSTAGCSGCHLLVYREGSSGSVDGIQFRAKLGTSTGRLATGSGNSANASRDYFQDFLPDIISYNGNRSTPTSMSLYRRGVLTSGGTASGTTGTMGLVIGARLSNNIYNAVFDGYLSEIIFYNKDLNVQEYAQVHSYLAIKYGITLSLGGGGTQGDLTASNGTNLWDASVHALYHNDVIAIGRDDIQGLYQKQSHTFNDTTKIYVGSLAASNTANTDSISNDISYVVVGHNGDQMCSNSNSNMEIPNGMGIFERVAREWRVNNENFNDAFNMEIKLSSCAIPLNIADLRLLVDDDGNFSNASVFSSGSGLTFSLSGSIVTINGISNTHIPANSTRYITIAEGNPTTGLADLTEDILNVFPNPATEKLIIEGSTLNLEHIKIMNMSGQLLNSSVNFKSESKSRISIDISGLEQGIYLLKVNSRIKRIVKN